MKSSTLETGHKLDKQDIAPAITMIEVKQGPFAGDGDKTRFDKEGT